jgi:hypothetical protein
MLTGQQPTAQAIPVSPVTFQASTEGYNIVPVIFIKNRTFIDVDSATVTALADSVLKLVTQINNTQKLSPQEIQFDCDWTETTRNSYFLFINHYRAASKQSISATIRLHQVKYPATTGIPPVDRGVLMYYNMGSINGTTIKRIGTAAKILKATSKAGQDSRRCCNTPTPSITKK